ncbi:hypothetical protein [Streptomyces sp. NPDC102437]|uniref:hypothetical protein n=1 Tax=Streptomyces sp. NPDC102437 TaxID=3366175 RepID=UPI003822450B
MTAPYTVGCVLEEQAETGPKEDLPADVPALGHEAAFEAGLALILGGLVQHTTTTSTVHPEHER